MNLHKKRILFYGFASSNYFFRDVIKTMVEQGYDANNLGVVFPNGQYARFYKGVLPASNVCYLYNRYNAVLKQVRADKDLSVVRQNFPDNAFEILAADKEGFRSLDAARQLPYLETIYRIYSDFVDHFRPDCIVFPDIEVVDGYVLYSIAKSRNIPIAYSFHLRNLGRSILGEHIHENFPSYFGEVTEQGVEQAAPFLNIQPADLPKASNFQPGWTDKPVMPQRRAILPIRLLKSLILRSGKERHYRGEDNFYQKFRTAILPALEEWRRFKYHQFVKPTMPVRTLSQLPENYYLFALQVTPESSINYLAPLYIDQLRALDEVRMALPPGSFLVVKEHPAVIGFRKMDFYRRVNRMPGVMLADAFLPMAQMADKAKGIFTVTGTVGLESLFSRKFCYMFGENFFSHYLPSKQSHPDLKALLRTDTDALMQEKQAAFKADLPKIFSISHGFITGEPFANGLILAPSNITAFIAAMEDHFGKIEDLRQPV